MVRFKYNLSGPIINLMRESIVNYNETFLYGIMNEGDVSQLRHCSLYLVCEETKIGEKKYMYSNPAAVIAKSITNAIGMYCNEFEVDSAFALIELEPRCDTIKVEAV